MNALCELDTDRITDLPEDVIQQILVLLPIKHAGKTATLSTNWRRYWRSIPQLVFYGGENGRLKSNKMMAKLISNIHKILLAHDGPITKFQLWVHGLKPCNGVDQTILHLSNRGLQEFALGFSPNHVYKLHSSLFSYLHLNSLVLWFCEFIRQPSWFVGFSKLTALRLIEVTLPSDFLSNFLPKCPSLKLLELLFCPCPSNLEIVAPRLTHFFFFGDSRKLSFKCTPLLSEVQILNGRQEMEKPADMVALFASLPLLQLCVVDIQLLEYLVAGDANLPIRLPTPLHQLKALYICIPDLGSLKNARAFLCLIMSSPSLYEVTIELNPKQLNQPVSNNVVASIGSLLEAENRHGFGCCLQHLTMFKIVGSLGMQVELDLLRFILATAPILRMIYITPAANLDSRKASKFMKKVRKYKPVSEKAKVISLPIRN